MQLQDGLLIGLAGDRSLGLLDPPLQLHNRLLVHFGFQRLFQSELQSIHVGSLGLALQGIAQARTDVYKPCLIRLGLLQMTDIALQTRHFSIIGLGIGQPFKLIELPFKPSELFSQPR